MAAVNTIHQKIVKKEWAPHSFEAIACCVMLEAWAMLVAVFVVDTSTNLTAQERKTRAKWL